MRVGAIQLPQGPNDLGEFSSGRAERVQRRGVGLRPGDGLLEVQDPILENDVVFGSVNANADHYRAAIDALAGADAAWLSRLMTRTIPMARWRSALQRRDDDVKVVIDLAG